MMYFFLGLLLVVIITAALHVLPAAMAALNNNSTKTIVAGFNNETAKRAIDNQNRLLNIAVLHNASLDKRLAIFSTMTLYNCINMALYTNTINSSSIWYSLSQRALQSCDSVFSSALGNHNSNTTSYLTFPPTLFTGFKPVNVTISLQFVNKTVLDTTRQYLKTRGIQ